MKNISKLLDHKNVKGKLLAPLNNILGDKFHHTSWARNRMPEYLWLGLILVCYGRKTGIDKAIKILSDISKIDSSLAYPQLSLFLSFPENIQKNFFKVISNHIDSKVLAPLTVIYRESDYPVYNQFFYFPKFRIEDKIDAIENVIKLYSPHQSNEATDLRFLAISLLIFNKKVSFAKETPQIVQAIYEYPTTEHEDKKMLSYRPSIRSMETHEMFFERNSEFINNFWEEIGMMTKCKPVCVKFDRDETLPSEFLENTQQIIEDILLTNKKLALEDHKFEVIMGSLNYAFKICKEVIENKLTNKILGRHAIRTIIEILIILKYLQKKETENPNIWQEYKYYGISKYKLILAKARESTSSNSYHIKPDLLNVIVNEKIWEEFIDIDLKYFDKQGIRDKSIEVDEKELYDLCYDYDSNYAHGLWGAVRESSMLLCTNPAHQYHNIPDANCNQELPSVQDDCVKVIKKILSIIPASYEIPSWYMKKYGINHE